jgi:uncharacterized membrane protein
MEMSTSINARADLAHAWQALTDVTSWPEWTTSMTSVERLDDGLLAVGSRARVSQPGMPSLVWEVSEVRDHEEFTWTTHSPGVRTSGRHLLHSNADGTTRITLEIRQSGPLSGLIGALTGRRTRRYLALEAAGLKAASEATTAEA